MGRRRAAEAVPVAEDGIQEVVVEHRKTRRGVRTTEKVVPVLIPTKEKPGQSSRSKKGKHHQLDPEKEKADGSEVQLPVTDYTHEHQFPDEQAYDPPDDEPEQGQSQANVCTQHCLY